MEEPWQFNFRRQYTLHNRHVNNACERFNIDINALLSYTRWDIIIDWDFILVPMSIHVTLGTTILLTYLKRSFGHVILLSNVDPKETSTLLYSLALTLESVTILLFMLNDDFHFCWNLFLLLTVAFYRI